MSNRKLQQGGVKNKSNALMMFDSLNHTSDLMNVKSPVNNVSTEKSDFAIKSVQKDITVKNLYMIQDLLKSYHNDMIESRGWNNKFSHGDYTILFKKNIEGDVILPKDNGKLLFDRIIEGHMIFEGVTKVSGLFILKSITESKINDSLKMFVAGMFPYVQIIANKSDGTIDVSPSDIIVPFNIILINIIYLNMFGRDDFDKYKKDDFFIPEIYDSNIISAFRSATGLHRA